MALLAMKTEGNQCSAVVKNVVLRDSKKAGVRFFPAHQFCLVLSLLAFLLLLSISES